MIETTALGAAGLAGLSAGLWSTAEEFLGARRFTRFAPSVTPAEAARWHGGWERAVRAALYWAREEAR